MANPGEALAATIDAQWNVGTGGVKPSDIEYIVNTSDFEPNPLAIDAIFVFLPLRGTKERFNSKLRNATYFPRVVCQTKTDTARLEQITNEVDRIVAAGTPITGATYQDVLEVNDISDRMRGGYPFWVSELNCKIFTQFESSATQYGTATVATLETDELTVNTWLKLNGYSVFDILDEDDMASDRADALITQQSAKAYVDVAYAAGMIGSANAAWVPMGVMGGQFFERFYFTAGKIQNVGADDYNSSWNLPKECLKGSLKLHIKNLKIGVVDADTDDFITQTTIYGVNGITITQLDIDATDHKTIGDKTFAGAVMPAAVIDVSGYQSVYVQLSHIATGAAQGDTTNLRMECYYDT